MKLIYSQDENAWYWQIESGYWSVSQLFETEEDAIEAQSRGTLKFGNDDYERC